jgi:prophage regulatory protein
LKNSILRLPSVISVTGLSRSTIYQKIKTNDFPKPINLGPRAVGWLQSEIDDWIALKVEQARKGAGGSQ